MPVVAQTRIVPQRQSSRESAFLFADLKGANLMASISPLIQPRYLAAAADNTTTNTGGNAATTSDVVSKDEFLKLLVAQLQNQDPLNPLQGDAFVAQLATFSSLEQLVSINSNIQKLVGALPPPSSTDSTQT
jgi:hypothetical protein